MHPDVFFGNIAVKLEKQTKPTTGAADADENDKSMKPPQTYRNTHTYTVVDGAQHSHDDNDGYNFIGVCVCVLYCVVADAGH